MSSLGRKFKRTKPPLVVSRELAFAALEDRLTRSAGEVDLPIVRTAKGETKMSDLLTELIDPYIVPDETLEMRRTLLTMGMLAWNATILDTDAVLDMLAATTGSMGVDDKEIALTLIGALSDRKTALFPDEKRFIVDFELKDHGSEFHLVVASAPLANASSSNQETDVPNDEGAES